VNGDWIPNTSRLEPAPVLTVAEAQAPSEPLLRSAVMSRWPEWRLRASL